MRSSRPSNGIQSMPRSRSHCDSRRLVQYPPSLRNDKIRIHSMAVHDKAKQAVLVSDFLVAHQDQWPE